MKIKNILIRNRKYILIAAAGFLLFIICSFCIKDENLNYIERLGVGEDESEMNVVVEGLTDKPQSIEIPISGRIYSDAEAKEAFQKGIDTLMSIILGENSSLQNITSKLDLVSEISDLGLSATWDTGDTDIVDVLGNIYNENLTQSVDLDIEVTLSDELHEETYIIPIRVCPKVLSETERQVKGLSDYIKKIDENERQRDGYTLPESFDGKKIAYKSADKHNFHFIWIIGLIIAALLFLREKKGNGDKIEKRKNELIKDYPDIVSKLIVFIGAGLSIRQSWESIVYDYESELKDTKVKRYAYEEMEAALARLKTGTHESLVYKEFGRACALRQYMKLASLLEQNRKSGLANLRTLLSIESKGAWEERVNLAKREGEKLSTKLLMPLFIMLGIVMTMIIVPALLIFY